MRTTLAARALAALSLGVSLVSAQHQAAAPTPPAAPNHGQTTGGGPAIGPFQDPIPGDEPDFAPHDLFGGTDGKPAISEPRANPYVLGFVSGEYAPARGVDPRLVARAAANPGGHTWGYIMVTGRMNHPDKVRAIETAGAKILGVHTWQSFQARFPLAAVEKLAALPFVHWVGWAQPHQKLDVTLSEILAVEGSTDKVRIMVSVFESDIHAGSLHRTRGKPSLSADGKTAEATITEVVPNGAFQKGLEAEGFEFLWYTDIDNVHVFTGLATPAQILKIRDLEFVSAVEFAPELRGSHDSSMSMISQDRVRNSWGGGVITTGEIDSGVYSVSSVRHNDLSAKWMVGWDNVGTGAYNDEHGHGTHVAGTIMGEGTVNNRYRGAAPSVARTAASRFFNGRFLNAANSGVGDPANLYNALRSAYNDGSNTSPRPRTVNNSWGASPPTGGYNGADALSRAIDGYVWSYQQCYVFASGNTGNGFCHSPGAAKNVLTVGAVVDHWNAVEPGDLASYSKSRTADSRQKPEVVAPGEWVTSLVRASNTAYTSWTGTSMATPHVTGALTSLIEHYNYFDYRPMNAKAMAMASAAWQGNEGTSSGYMTSAVGYGLINAAKMHGTSPTVGWWTGTYDTNITSSGSWVYWDFAVPSTAKHLKIVMVSHEPAAASSASQAVINRMQLWVDIPPFTASGNSGEYNSSVAAWNVQSVASTGLATAAAGKTIRVKAYASSIASGSAARVGFVALWLVDTPVGVNPVLTTSASPAIVKPSAAVTLNATLSRVAGNDEFDNARIYPTLPSGWTVTELRRTGADNILQTYTNSSHPSSPYPSLTGGMTVGQGTSRLLTFLLQAPSASGTYTPGATAIADPRSSTSFSSTSSVCVDGLAPANIAGLTSTSHTLNAWSNVTTLAMRWNAPTDNGCAGIDGLANTIAQGSPSTPTAKTLNGALTTHNPTVSPSALSQYYAIRALDKAGNLSASTTSWGPFFIDTSNPTMTLVSINNGATYASSLNVNVMASASDTYSGPNEMRYSSNNSTWSAWRAYTTSPVAYDLSSNGGNTNQGTKTVYVQVRDRAGNISASASDTITYDSVAPVVSSVVLNSGAAYTNSLTASTVITATGSPTEMRWSMDNATWSPWTAYSTTAFNANMTLYGGNSTPGVKRLYAQARDAAGNVSASASDTITYLPTPSLTSPSPSSVNVLNKTSIVLNGNNLADVNRVTFGATSITSTNPDDWWQGYFAVLSNTQVRLYPPQNQNPGNYAVAVHNPGYSSGSVNVAVTHNTTRFCASPATLKRGTTLNAAVHRDGEPSNAISVMVLSLSGTPLNIPGLISLAHGGHPVTIIDSSLLVLPAQFHDPTKHTAVWPLPIPTTVPAFTIYFQAMMFDPTNPLRQPITTSTSDKTSVHI